MDIYCRKVYTFDTEHQYFKYKLQQKVKFALARFHLLSASLYAAYDELTMNKSWLRKSYILSKILVFFLGKVYT